MEQAVPVVLGCSCLIQFARKKTQKDALEVTFKDENPLEFIVEGKSGTLSLRGLTAQDIKRLIRMVFFQVFIILLGIQCERILLWGIL